MLNFIRLIILLFSLNFAIASTNFKNESFQEFKIAVSENSAQDIDYQGIYENNLLSVEQRYLFYKRIISLHEIRNWNPKLKSIVLIKLVNFDLQNEQPAYLKFNEGRHVFIDMINQFMKEEFDFLEKMKADIIEDARLKGEEITNVEFDDSQMDEIIDIVYNKLIVDNNNNYLFLN